MEEESKNFFLGDSYLFKKVLLIINELEHEFKDIKIKVIKSHSLMDSFPPMYATGCQLDFVDLKFAVSIQTNSEIAGPAFCETALIEKEKGVIYEKELGYDDCIRHDSEEDLKEHLKMLFQKLPTYKTHENNDHNQK